METQQNTHFPQVQAFSPRQLRYALQLAEERSSCLLLRESGLGPEAYAEFLAEVRAEIERRRAETP